MLLSLLTASALAAEAPPPPDAPTRAAASSAYTYSGPLGKQLDAPPQLDGLWAHSHELAIAGSIGASVGYLAVVAMWNLENLSNGTGGATILLALPAIGLGAPVALLSGVLSIPPAMRLTELGTPVSPVLGVASVAASIGGASLFVVGLVGPYAAFQMGLGLLGAAPLLALGQCLLTRKRGLDAAQSDGLSIGWVPLKGGAMASLGVRF